MNTDSAVVVGDEPTVGSLIEQSRLSLFHAKLLLVTFLVMLLDGFGMQALGLVAPVIGKLWKLQPGALGPAFSAGLVGMLFGATLLASMGDRWGRKRAVILGVTICALSTLAMAQAGSTSELVILRLLIGAGVGLAMPNAVALCAEYMPLRFRGTSVTIMFVGFTAGSVTAGFTAPYLIPNYGWASLFVFGGVLSLASVVVGWLALPESLQYLLTKADGQQRVRGILDRIVAAELRGQPVSYIAEKKKPGMPVRHLFSEGRTPLTLMLWVSFVASLFTVYFILNWLPSLIASAGLPLAVASRVTGWFSIGGIVGALSIGWLIDHKITKAVVVYFALGAISIAMVGQVGTSVSMLELAAFCAGVFVVGAQTGLNVLSAFSYPKYLVATGVGWALGIGRFGSIIGPAVGGAMAALKLSTQQTFGCGAIPMTLGGLACTVVLWLRSRRPVEGA